MKKKLLICDICNKEVEQTKENQEQIREWQKSYQIGEETIDYCPPCESKVKKANGDIIKIKEKSTLDIKKIVDKLIQ